MFFRRDLPIALGFLTGAVIILSNFVKYGPLAGLASYLLNWRVILAAYALGIGAVNILGLHLARIKQKRVRYWQLSYWLIFMFAVTLIIGITQGTKSAAYAFVFDNTFTPLGAATFALHAFFLVTAAMRSFIATNLETWLFMLGGVIVMLGQVGIGTAMWDKLPALRSWIMEIPNAAAMRAITAGSSLGLVTLGLRVIVGLERSHLGAE